MIDMRDSHEKTNLLRETLQFVVGSDMPSQHKKVIIEALVQALRTVDETEQRPVAANDSEQWQPHESQLVGDFLQGKVAANWQHADELLISLANQLHRSPNDVKQKATDLGFGVGVDYRQARARTPDER